MSGERDRTGFLFWLGGKAIPGKPVIRNKEVDRERENWTVSWKSDNQGRDALDKSTDSEHEISKETSEGFRNDRLRITNAELSPNTNRESKHEHSETRQDELIPSRVSSRASEDREFRLISFESSLFEPREIHFENTMNNDPQTSRLTEAEIETDIEQMRQEIRRRESDTIKGSKQPEVSQMEIMIDFMREIRQQMDEVQEQLQEYNAREQRRNEYYALPGRREEEASAMTGRISNNADVAYGRGISDVRNRRLTSETYLSLKEARSLIPAIDGTSQNGIQEFLSASTFAIESINPIDEPLLLKTILCTKLKGKVLLDFQTRDIQTFAQLKAQIEASYTTHKSVTHLQIEFNTLKQRLGESAQAFGTRVEQLAMKLYESMIEGQAHTVTEKNIIKMTIQSQALQNYQIGLQDNVKIIVRSRNYKTLQEAVAVATAEEKMQGTNVANRASFRLSNNSWREKSLKCIKCGKLGHDGRDCRTSRYQSNNRFQLPKADGQKLYAVETYCKHCKRAGHTHETCWQLHGKPDKDSTRPKINRAKQNEEDNVKQRITRPAKTMQIASINKELQANPNVYLVALPIVEVEAKRLIMLVDTGAVLTLIKVKNLKGETPVIEEKTTIVGATGQKIDTLGTVMATITLDGRKIKHTVHIVKDDFPVNHEGILGADFLKKYAKSLDFTMQQLKIGESVLRLFPDKQIALAPRSETIISAITNEDATGVVDSLEIQPGVIMGAGIVRANNYSCTVSVINITDKEINIQVPHVEITPMECEAEILGITTEVCEENKIPLSRTEKIKGLLRLNHLNEEEKRAIIGICKEYKDIFHLEGEPLTCTSAVKHEIATRPDTAAANTRPYRLPEKHKEEVNKQVQTMLKNKIIRPSASQWNAPLLVVPKKMDASGKPKMRVVVDFRKLNDVTIGDSFPLPNITDILDQLGNSKYFTTLDLASGYHQIPMAEGDKGKTAFSTPFGHYEFNRMPFGLKNAPATFQRLMNTILAGIQGIRCLVYLDDIVVYGASLEEHNRRLVEVLRRIRANNLKLQPDKCEFLRKEVVYLGHIISEYGIMPDPGKIEAVQTFPTPKKIKDIQSFIGLAGYYRKFIENFSKIVKPLTKLTKKGEKFEWTQEQQNAFDDLKAKLTTAPILQYPKFNEEFVLTTDASDFAIGAILSQGEIGRDRPIAYASRILSRAEQNYNTTEKELLAIVWAVKHFRPYLYGTKFKIVTDHKPLIWLFNVTDPGSRLIRWRLKLEEYDYEIIHKAGKNNVNADALSRNVAQAVNAIEEEGKRDVDLEEDSKNKEERKSEIKGYTEEEKRQIIYEYHDAPTGGHQGVQRTINRIKLTHNWKGLNKDIEEYIAKCEFCQKNKLRRRNKAPMIITDTPDRPFEKCAVDIVGPLTVTANGNKYVLTFQDHLTKFSKAMPIANQEAGTVAKEFVTKIVLEYGIPEKLLTDQGTNFMSNVLKDTCKLLKIDKVNTSAYHPESNGALERSHRTLAEYLRHYINEEQTDWDEWLPYAMFVYNTTPHTATDYTPFELIYGHRATIPTSLTYPPKTTYTYDNYVSELKEKLRSAHRVAKANIQEEKVKAKAQYDKKTNSNNFRVGDRVLLHDEALRRGRSKKLEALWRGPYIILKRNSEVNYTIKTGRRNMTVHVNRLKLFVEN